jgi:hypothetical protein
MDTAGALLDGRGIKFVYKFTSEPFMNTFRPSFMALYTDTQIAPHYKTNVTHVINV